MKPPPWLAIGIAALAAGLLSAMGLHAQSQRPAAGQITTRSISVAGARPVADAMDAIELRYGVSIDYLDAEYADPKDMVSISYRPGHVTVGPMVRSISVQYTEAPGCPKSLPLMCYNYAAGGVPVTAWPVGGITALIQRVLDQFAADGGQVFAVRKMVTTYATGLNPGPRWLVYPDQVRDASGKFVQQPDFLGTRILSQRKPANRRTVPLNTPPSPAAPTVAERLAQAQKQMQAVRLRWETIFTQLDWAWGTQFPTDPKGPDPNFQIPNEAKDQYMSAWRAITEIIGPFQVMRFFYAPDTHLYYTNIANLPSPPYQPPPRPANPASQSKPATLAPFRPRPPAWLGLARTPRGVRDIQGALVKAGYLRTAPTTEWDRNASLALERFQTANALPVTGKIDDLTLERLWPYLPKVMPLPMPSTVPNPLGRQLYYWLRTTRGGNRDIQRALEEEGFYSGPLTGNFWDAKTQTALKAFQTANGLKPTGIFDDATSRKLAPLLLQMKN